MRAASAAFPGQGKGVLLTFHRKYSKLQAAEQEPLVASLFLVAMPFAPSSFLLLVVRPSVLAPSSDEQKILQ